MKGKYYDLSRILKKDATYNMVIGKRSNGKTHAAIEYALKKFFKTREQFAYVRRWREDVIGRRASMVFSDFNSSGEIAKMSKGLYDRIHYYSGVYYGAIEDEKTGKAVYSDTHDAAGYLFALSDTEHDKSTQYPGVTTIIFDEFMARRVYLPDEFVLFMNVVSTIIRNRDDVKIFMLGNTVNDHAPYIKEMGLKHLAKMKLGDIDVYSYADTRLRVAVEMSDAKGGNDNSQYFAFDNPQLRMITDGQWELGIFPHCPVKFDGKDVKFVYFIIFDGDTYQCEIVDKDRMPFTYIHRKTTPIREPGRDLIYTLEYNPALNYNRSVYKPINEAQKTIKWFFDNDRVYYQDNSVGNAISQYLSQCRYGN